MKHYTTREDAIQREIRDGIDSDIIDDFDIEAFADEVLDADQDGYFLRPEFLARNSYAWNLALQRHDYGHVLRASHARGREAESIAYELEEFASRIDDLWNLEKEGYDTLPESMREGDAGQAMNAASREVGEAYRLIDLAIGALEERRCIVAAMTA